MVWEDLNELLDQPNSFMYFIVIIINFFYWCDLPCKVIVQESGMGEIEVLLCKCSKMTVSLTIWFTELFAYMYIGQRKHIIL